MGFEWGLGISLNKNKMIKTSFFLLVFIWVANEDSLNALKDNLLINRIMELYLELWLAVMQILHGCQQKIKKKKSDFQMKEMEGSDERLPRVSYMIDYDSCMQDEMENQRRHEVR